MQSLLFVSTDNGHTIAKYLLLLGQNSNTNPKLDIKAEFFFRNNGLLMKNMDKGLTVPKWVMIVWPKIPQISPEFICPNPKVPDFNEKKSFIGGP
jgi:hypothetical protein